MENKKVLRPTLIGFVLLLLALIITGAFGVSNLMDGGVGNLYGHDFTYGLRASIGYFFQLWRPSHFMHETSFIGLVLVLVAITTTVTLIIMSILKKKYIFIVPALLLGATISYLPFIFILVIPMVQLGVMRAIPQLFMGGVTGLTLFAMYFEFLAVKKLFIESMQLLDKAAGEKKEEPKEEQPAEAAVAGLSEEQVREIVEQYMKEHVDELHVPGEPVFVVEPEDEEDEEPVEEPEDEPEEQPAEEPVEEQPEEQPEEEPQPEPEPEEQPAEEPEEQPEEEADEEEGDEEEGEGEEAPADPNAPAGLNIKGKRRRASFETRLKNSEFDLRHKYYDLRDYIKWYGIKNRISIPGDTFSYKRQRQVFVTIVGKHIRVYLNLDPNDYADSTIPVEPALAKKYEDLPCLLRVKSDLSYRRAKKLVDDVMQKIGIDKPDEDEPKETQKVD